MIDKGRIALMRQHAENLHLIEFDSLTEELILSLKGEDLGEVFLTRGQLKLFTADETIIDDLRTAKQLLPRGSQQSSVLLNLTLLDPNGFLMFKPAANSIGRFMQALRESQDILQEYCGEVVYGLGRQIESEILYFCGQIEKAAALAELQYTQSLEQKRYSYAIMAGYVLLRSYLAAGNINSMEQILVQIIKLAKTNPHPSNSQMYRTIRAWTNLTTGWSGDTPRYHITPKGVVFPALEDRREAIQKGISHLGPTEAPFEDYAKIKHPDIYTIRKFYMDIFNAMEQCKFGKKDAAKAIFRSAYILAQENQLCMPFVEYGNQILPLLEYMAKDLPNSHAKEWNQKLISLANQYEENLNKFRQD